MILVSLVVTSTSHAERAEHGNFGLGVFLGAPTGITAKLWLSERGALDLAVGIDFYNTQHNYDISAQFGYLFHFPIDIPSGYLAPYIGAGGHISVNPVPDSPESGKTYLGIRAALGLEYIYNPISFFVEMNPVLFFYPLGLSQGFGGGVGFRYYFGK